MNIETTKRSTFTISCLGGGFSPADSTTYYFGLNSITNITAANMDFSVGYVFTIIGAILTIAANTTSGSNENCTLQIRNTTQATSSSIGTFQTNGADAVTIAYFSFTNLNIAVAASDLIAVQVDTPAWASNPIDTRWYCTLICER